MHRPQSEVARARQVPAGPVRGPDLVVTDVRADEPGAGLNGTDRATGVVVSSEPCAATALETLRSGWIDIYDREVRV